MEDDLNFFENRRRPQFFENRRRPQFFEIEKQPQFVFKWKTTSICFNGRQPQLFLVELLFEVVIH